MTKSCLSTLALCMICLASPLAVRAAERPTAATNPSTDQAGPAKFYGTISAVDATAKTFTIDGQTYAVVGETHMTKAADDSAATIADAVVGETARGTYTKTTDGKLNVTKVRFGKKTGGKQGGGKSGGKKKDADSPAASATEKPAERK